MCILGACGRRIGFDFFGFAINLLYSLSMRVNQ